MHIRTKVKLVGFGGFDLFTGFFFTVSLLAH